MYRNKLLIIDGLIIALINFTGCYSFNSINVSEYDQFKKDQGTPQEIYVKTKNNLWYHFTNYDFYVKNDTLYGNGRILSEGWHNTQNCKIAIDEIESLGVEKLNMYTTSVLAGLGILSVLTIAVLFFEVFIAD